MEHWENIKTILETLVAFCILIANLQTALVAISFYS